MHSLPASACAVPGCRGLVGFPLTILYDGVRVGSPQHRGLPFFLPDCFLLLLCHFYLLFHHPGKHSCQNIDDLSVHSIF